MTSVFGLFLAVVVFAFIFGFLVLYWAHKEGEKHTNRLNAELQSKLEIEQQKPMYIVSFTTLDCAIYRTKPFKATYLYNIITSKDCAEDHLKSCYYRGYFETYTGITVPVTQIMKAEVKLY